MRAHMHTHAHTHTCTHTHGRGRKFRRPILGILRLRCPHGEETRSVLERLGVPPTCPESPGQVNVCWWGMCSSPTKRPSRDPSLGPASTEQARAEPQGPAQERKLQLLWRALCPAGCPMAARPWPQEGMLAGVSRLGRPPGPEGTRGAAPQEQNPF